MAKPKKLGMPAAYTSNARKRQNVGSGLLQATIGWHVWSRNAWNVKRRT